MEAQTAAAAGALAGLEWWRDKLVRMQDRTFAVPKHALRVLDALLASGEGKVEAPGLEALARTLGVPLKFAPRAIASVARLGIVTARLQSPTYSIRLHRERLARRKIASSRPRRRIPPAERRELLLQSDWRCACCGRKFPARQLVIDHLVPLSLLGADHAANWVVMFRRHNAKKWDRFVRDELKFYRREKVLRRIGVRFIDGWFWPVVNGRPRYGGCR